MHLVATLISAGPDPLIRGLAAAVRRTLSIRAEPLWLAPGEACDLFLDASDPKMVAAEIRAAIGAAPVDVLVQPCDSRRQRLLVADLEATIIEHEMLDELAEILGIGPEIATITRRAMNGEIDFAEALAARVALLAGTEAQVIDQAAGRIRLTAGARILVATIRRAGARTALVTGGFTVFADRVAADLGFDRVVANRLEIVDGRLSGGVSGSVVNAEAKREALLACAAEFGILPGEVIAAGDGTNDLPMLHAAGLGIAFRAKPAVAAAIGTRLEHADLTGLLYAQGFRRSEFVV